MRPFHSFHRKFQKSTVFVIIISPSKHSVWLLIAVIRKRKKLPYHEHKVQFVRSLEFVAFILITHAAYNNCKLRIQVVSCWDLCVLRC